MKKKKKKKNRKKDGNFFLILFGGDVFILVKKNLLSLNSVFPGYKNRGQIKSEKKGTPFSGVFFFFFF